MLSLRSSAEREHPRGGSTPLSEDVCRELHSESAPRLSVRRALQGYKISHSGELSADTGLLGEEFEAAMQCALQARTAATQGS